MKIIETATGKTVGEGEVSFKVGQSLPKTTLPVIPSVQEWEPSGKKLSLALDHFDYDLDETFRKPAEAMASSFRSDVKALNRLAKAYPIGLEPTTPVPAAKADACIRSVLLRLVKPEVLDLGEEGYRLDLAAPKMTLSANTLKGLYWGTQTILQLIDASKGSNIIPSGTVQDYPRYRIRGFMLDAGRKYYPLDYLRDYARILSYYKMNTFHIHLNDCQFYGFHQDYAKTYAAFRLESEKHPGLTAKDGFYTKAGFRDFVKKSAAMGVEIVPEIDSPSHALAFTHYKPELAAKRYGMDYLDLHNPDLLSFMKEVFDEYISGDDPVFAGPKVHIGIDEYKGGGRKEAEYFRAYADAMLKHIASRGKRPCAWGALSNMQGKTPVFNKNVIMDIWYNPYYQPR